jgi:hypothetical protein
MMQEIQYNLTARRESVIPEQQRDRYIPAVS